MAALDTSRTAFGSNTAAASVTSFFASVVSTVVGWNDARVTRNALAALTDRELEDIGLIRGDIDLVATHTIMR